MSLIKIAFALNAQQRRDHRNAINAWQNKIDNQYQQEYAEPLATAAKKLGVANPEDKALRGIGIGSLIGFGAGSLIGGFNGKTPLERVALGAGIGAIGALGGASIGANYGNKERKYIHAKYPELAKKREEINNNAKLVLRNSPR